MEKEGKLGVSTTVSRFKDEQIESQIITFVGHRGKTKFKLRSLKVLFESLYQKNIYFCFTDYAKAFDCVDHNKL